MSNFVLNELIANNDRDPLWMNRYTGLPLLFKTKIQGQFKVFVNILPRIQGFCTFFKVL